MKKSAILAAALVLCASQAWAYDNPYAGYSVNDGNPFCKVVSSKHYAYSGVGAQPVDELEKIGETSVHLINYYTADEMEQIIGEKFSTAYFAKQYEQMALLQRSQLDVRTVPAPLVDMKRYASYNASYNNEKNLALQVQRQLFQEQLDNVKPIITLEKINGQQTIKLSYLYKQADDLVALDMNLLSANDRLYVLATLKKLLPQQAKADSKAEDAQANDNPADASAIQQEIGEALNGLLHIENVNAADVDAKALTKFHKEHHKFLKGFKTTAPVKNSQALSFTDPTARKSVTLPPDWFYSQIQVREKEASGTITMAASLPVIQKIAAEFDYEGAFAILKTAVDEPEAFPTQQAQDKATEEARKALQNFDAFLLTCSIKSQEEDFRQYLRISADTEFAVREALQRLQGFENEYFSLQKYSYGVSYKNGKAAYLDVNSKLLLMQDFSFDNFLRLTTKPEDTGSVLFYLHKSNLAPDEQIMQGLKNWQF